MKPQDFLGAEPERLRLDQLTALAGHWIAMEIYDRDVQPSRRIVAVGDSAADCIRQLAARGLDAGRYEFRLFGRP